MPKRQAAAKAAAPTAKPATQAADPAKAITRWLDQIELYERDTQAWTTRGETIVKRYRDERDSPSDKKRRFNILYSITETGRPALYARNPKPDIQRRFKDADPIGRVASDVLERSASYFVDTDLFGRIMRSTVMDYLLPGRGTVWIRYVPHMQAVAPLDQSEEAEEGEEVTDDVPPSEVIAYEEVVPDYVHWKDYGHNICRTWDEVWVVWRKVYLDREQLKKRFGDELGKKIPLDYVQKNSKGATVEGSDGSKATIYEAWDKIKGCAVWLHKAMPEYLDHRDDPLKLKDFFPCPKMLAATLANDSLIPVPFYVEYQDQAQELDTLTARIAALTKAVKVAGVYDSSAQGIDRLLSEGVDNKLIAVDAWAAFAQKGGINGSIAFLPLVDILNALKALYETRDKVKEDLYEITGYADIIRGVSDPQETMGAQQIKSNFATLRIGDHQRAVQEFVREIVRIMVDVIAGHFQIETIKEISGVRLFTKAEKEQYSRAIGQAQQATQAPQLAAGTGAPPMPPAPPAPPAMPPLPPNTTMDQFQQMMTDPTWEEVAALIKNDALRCFRIDIETDSTIKQDEQQEKADRVEFLKAAGGFLKEAVEAGSQQPEMAPLLGQMLMFGIRGFKVGKELEGSFNAAIAKLEKQAANPQQKPDPAMAKVQGELELNKQRAQADIQVAQATQQAQAQQSTLENQQQHEREMAKIAAEERVAVRKAEIEGKLQLEVAHIKAAAQIETARITKGASDGGQAEAREVAGEGAGAGAPVPPEAIDPPAQDVDQPPPRDNELHGKLDMLMQHLANQAQPEGQPQQPDMSQHVAALIPALQRHGESMDRLHKAVTAEKEIVRDAKGKPTGVRIKPDTKALGAQLKEKK